MSLILLWLLHAVENVKFRFLFGPCGLCRTFSNRLVPSNRSVRVEIAGKRSLTVLYILKFHNSEPNQVYHPEKLNSLMETPSISIVEKSIVDNAAVNCLLVSPNMSQLLLYNFVNRKYTGF